MDACTFLNDHFSVGHGEKQTNEPTKKTSLKYFVTTGRVQAMVPGRSRGDVGARQDAVRQCRCAAERWLRQQSIARGASRDAACSGSSAGKLLTGCWCTELFYSLTVSRSDQLLLLCSSSAPSLPNHRSTASRTTTPNTTGTTSCRTLSFIRKNPRVLQNFFFFLESIWFSCWRSS